MALPINIETLITGKTIETERIEYKEGFVPEEVLHSICAFANDLNNWGGGYIIIGIKADNGVPVLPPVGLEENQVEAIQNKIVEYCYKIMPNYTPIIDCPIFGGKRILILWVPGGDNRPYEAPISIGKTKPFVLDHYVRKGASTVRATAQDKEKLFELAKKTPFDDKVNHEANISDLNIHLIKEFLSEINSKLVDEIDTLSHEELCKKMNIARGATEYFKPINVGLLLFNENPESFFRGACIEVVYYQDDVGDRFEEKRFSGPIHKQLRQALQFIQSNYLKEKIIKVPGKAESIRVFNYPYEAVEEALANAVFHRSYENQSPVEVSLRKDRIEILSYPGPLPPLNREKLKLDRVIAREYRNRRIGDFLKELHLTEGRGTGIPKIRQSLRLNNSPSPIFETDIDCTYFLSMIPMNKAFVGLVLANYQYKVLVFCLEPRSKREILEFIGLKSRHENFTRHITPLLDSGFITYTNPNMPNSPKQKYITTELGKDRISTP